MENIIYRLSEALLSNKEASNSNANDCNGHFCNNREEFRDHSEGGMPMFSSKLAKLEFPRYSGDDPTGWLTRVDLFFEYQGTMEA